MKYSRSNLSLWAFAMVALFSVQCRADIASETRKLAGYLQLQPGQSVADVGAGDGEWSEQLAAIVGEAGRVLATEVDEAKISKIEKRMKRAGLDNVTTILGNQDGSGLQEGSCDGILLRLVYHHFSDPKAMQSDLWAALKPGGRIAVVDFSPKNSLGRSNVPDFRDGHGVESERIVEEMQAAGFRLLEEVSPWGDNRDQERFLLVFEKPE